MYNKLLSLVFIAFFTLSTFAQSSQDEIQLMQSLYGMEKRDIVAEFVEISEAQATEFWALYDEYENQRKELGRKKYQLLQSFVDDYGQVKAEDADAFMKQAIPLRIKSDKLTDNYYKKVKSKTDPIVAMQFYQIENYLADAIKMELLEDIYTSKQ
jgi:hypothetical protein